MTELKDMTRDEKIEERINNEIDNCEMAYKIQDRENNVFVFSRIENDCPLYRGMGGSKHIFDLRGYEVLEKYCRL